MWKRDLRTWNRLSSVSILKQDLGPESLKKRAKFLLSQVEMVFKNKTGGVYLVSQVLF